MHASTEMEGLACWVGHRLRPIKPTSEERHLLDVCDPYLKSGRPARQTPLHVIGHGHPASSWDIFPLSTTSNYGRHRQCPRKVTNTRGPNKRVKKASKRERQARKMQQARPTAIKQDDLSLSLYIYNIYVYMYM